MNTQQANRSNGFTLIEVIFSILILGMMVISITALYYTAQKTLHSQQEMLPLDSRMRGRMEEILSRPFAAISAGSESVTINGENHTISWSVTPPDLDGDTLPETTAKTITVTVGSKSLTTLVIDSQGLLGKI